MVVAENKNLVVVVGRGSLLGGIFQVEGMSKFLASGGTPPAKKTLAIVVPLCNWYLQHWRINFDTHVKTGKQKYNLNQEAKQLSC